MPVRLRTGCRSKRSLARSTWRSRSAATAISRHNSTRSACGRRLAIRRSSPRPTASPTRTCGAFPPISSPARSTACHDSVRRDRGAPPHLLFDDRLRLRARVRARRARVAAAGGRARPVPRARRSDRSRRAARAAVPGRSVRALPPPRRFPARRASRSRGSTCSCRSSTR